MQVLSTVCSRPCQAIKADQTILICGCVLVPDLIEHRALVKFREVALKVELGHVLDICRVFCSPTVCGFERLLPFCLTIRSVCRCKTDSAAYNPGSSCLWLFGGL
jgi:hypothetical protein